MPQSLDRKTRIENRFGCATPEEVHQCLRRVVEFETRVVPMLGDVMSLSRQNRWLGAGGGGAVVREGWARGVSSAHGRPYHPVSSQALSHHHADPHQFRGLPGEKGSL